MASRESPASTGSSEKKGRASLCVGRNTITTKPKPPQTSSEGAGHVESSKKKGQHLPRTMSDERGEEVLLGRPGGRKASGAVRGKKEADSSRRLAMGRVR